MKRTRRFLFRRNRDSSDGRDRRQVACLCGRDLLAPGEGERGETGCDACGRRFALRWVRDPRTGEELAAPVYLDRAVEGEAEVLPEAALQSDEAASPDVPAPADESRPRPPRALYFVCACGAKLIGREETYGRRVRCPQCAVRLVLALVYDDVERRYDIEPLPSPEP